MADDDTTQGERTNPSAQDVVAHVIESPMGGWHVHGIPGSFRSKESAILEAWAQLARRGGGRIVVHPVSEMRAGVPSRR